MGIFSSKNAQDVIEQLHACQQDSDKGNPDFG
jgi:hypothetical protein